VTASTHIAEVISYQVLVVTKGPHCFALVPDLGYGACGASQVEVVADVRAQAMKMLECCAGGGAPPEPSRLALDRIALPVPVAWCHPLRAGRLSVSLDGDEAGE
jgi:hypothetical protein